MPNRKAKKAPSFEETMERAHKAIKESRRLLAELERIHEGLARTPPLPKPSK